MSRIDESRPFIPVNIAVLTVSDTRTQKEDRSGASLETMLTEAGHNLAARTVVKDDVAAIQAVINGWIDDKDVDVVITTGGTGFTGRDVTPEAVRPLFEKEIEGFSVAFHMLSWEKIGTLHRAIAGMRRISERHLYLLSSRFARSLQGRLERHPEMATRQQTSPLQLRRDHAST